ncbi:hypothetical protein SpCBS45565_g06478 [Spizellomyces sp. 'palustris']|nr:hypothetical protein SpCBS45565_g06478 [Spizellomyces sp. 'palustris']
MAVLSRNLFQSIIVAISSVLFALWAQDISSPWIRLLFYAEAAVQALLSLSGFINNGSRGNKGFLYHEHGNVHLHNLIAINTGILVTIRLCLVFPVQYHEKRAVPVVAAGMLLRHLKFQQAFGILILVNLIWAWVDQSLAVALYSVNCAAGSLLKGRFPSWAAEIVNIALWFFMKRDFS